MSTENTTDAAPLHGVVHTPGPWEILVLSDGHIDIDGPDSESVCEIPVKGTSAECSIANGRLIAAAPELLEALIDFVETVRRVDPGVYQDSITQANDAIKRATGEVV